MSECETCDTHGPQLTADAEAWLALHRALCPVWRQMVATLMPLLEWLNRALGGLPAPTETKPTEAKRSRWGVLGSTYLDARDVAQHLPLDIQTVPLSITFPSAAHGMTLDNIMLTPRAKQDPGLDKALAVITPALATRKPHTEAPNGRA